MNQIANCYFKDRPDGVSLMSGLPLPKDVDGAVRKYKFINCDFHPNCGRVQFEDCIFVECSGVEYITHNLNARECRILTGTEWCRSEGALP